MPTTATALREGAILSAPETAACYTCGNEFPKDETAEFDGRTLCSGCLDDETFLCERCGERLWNDGNAGEVDLRGAEFTDTVLCPFGVKSANPTLSQCI